MQDARIHTTSDGWALDSFIVLFGLHEADYQDHVGTVQRELATHLRRQEQCALPPFSPRARRSGPGHRQARAFPVMPKFDLQPDARSSSWRLSIVCADRAGLLYDFAVLFSAHKIDLKMAKIHTLGERVEDTFIIEGKQLADTQARRGFETALLDTLNGH